MGGRSIKTTLTSGPILGSIIRLSVPIMATSLMQTAHNLVNILFLGRLGERYVATASLAGQFLWLSMAVAMLWRVSGEIGVAQNLGGDRPQEAQGFGEDALKLSVICGVPLAILAVVFRSTLIGVFNVDDPVLHDLAADYLGISILSLPFFYGHFVLTGIYGGSGNTKLPFYINSVSFLVQISVSYSLIFVAGFGVFGAAIALPTASAINFFLKLWAIKRWQNRPFEKFGLLTMPDLRRVRTLISWGGPVAIESALFTGLFMIMTRLIASFGEDAIAAHGVGMQIEAVAFMVASGFMSAYAAFVGQNYGAREFLRLRTGHRLSSLVMGAYGAVVMAGLLLLAVPVIGMFLSEPYAIEMGVSYLRIIGLAQILFCMECVATGSFRGRGKTIKPTIVSVTSNVVRVILTYGFVWMGLGVTGIWIGIFAAMTLKSIWLIAWHWYDGRRDDNDLQAIGNRQ